MTDLETASAADLIPLLADRTHGSEAYDRLRAMGPVASVALLTGICSEVPWIRARSLDLLGKLGDRQHTARIAAALSDRDAFVRMSAIESLTRMRDPRSLDALLKAIADRDPALRLAALKALTRVRSSAAVTAISQLLEDPELFVREGACLALETLGSVKPAVRADLLKRAMRDSHPHVRSSAIRVAGLTLPLGLCRDALLEAMDDSDPWVASQAKYILNYLEKHAEQR
jgi:HEAT repeat protein